MRTSYKYPPCMQEVAEYDADFPESSIGNLQYMLSSSSGTFGSVNPAGPVLGFTKATTLMSTSYFQALVGVRAVPLPKAEDGSVAADEESQPVQHLREEFVTTYDIHNGKIECF